MHKCPDGVARAPGIFQETQLLLAKYFQENMGNKSIPPFVHNLRIRSQDRALTVQTKTQP